MIWLCRARGIVLINVRIVALYTVDNVHTARIDIHELWGFRNAKTLLNINFTGGYRMHLSGFELVRESIDHHLLVELSHISSLTLYLTGNQAVLVDM